MTRRSHRDLFLRASIFLILAACFLSYSSSVMGADGDLASQGKAYLDKGDFSNAIQTLEKARASGHDTPDVKKLLAKAYYNKAYDAVLANDFKTGLGLLNQAIKLDPGSKEIRDTLTMVKSAYEAQTQKKQPKPKPKKAAPQPTATEEPVSVATAVPAAQAVATPPVQAGAPAATSEAVKDALEQFKKSTLYQQQASEEAIKAQQGIISYLYLFIAIIGGVILVGGGIGFFVHKRKTVREAEENRSFMSILNHHLQVVDKEVETLTSFKFHSIENLSTNVLKIMLDAQNPRIRARCIELLEERFKIENTSKETVIEILSKLLNDPDNRVRGNVVKALFAYDPALAKENLKVMINHPSEFMKLSAAWICGEMQDPEGLTWLIKMMHQAGPHLKLRIKSSLKKFLTYDHPDIKSRQKLVHKTIELIDKSILHRETMDNIDKIHQKLMVALLQREEEILVLSAENHGLEQSKKMLEEKLAQQTK